MRKRITNLFILLVFLAGAAFLFYPTMSDAWNRYRNKQLISSYSSAVTSLTKNQYDRIWKDAEEYNKQHTCNVIKDTFNESDHYIMSHPYDTLLNPNGDEVMGYIEIPKINVNLAIYHGTGVTALENGVGHVEGTSLPIGGEGTHAVLSAHRGLPSAKLFTDLDQMQEGDVFYIHVLDEVHAYQVDQILTVLPSETEALGIEEGKDYVTLLTCTPYAVNTHRLLVRGHRIAYDEKEYEENSTLSEGKSNDNLSVKLLLAGCIVFLLIVVYIWRKSRVKKSHDTKA